jgi:hypothetical protein
MGAMCCKGLDCLADDGQSVVHEDVCGMDHQDLHRF